MNLRAMDIGHNQVTPCLISEPSYDYVHHRVSDPNMCSTARYSPPYSGQKCNIEDIVPCSGKEEVQNVVENRIIGDKCEQYNFSENRLYSDYNIHTAASNNTAFVGHKAPHSSENTHSVKLQSTEVVENTTETIQEVDPVYQNLLPTLAESTTAQIVFHRSSNGQIYQNYYIHHDNSVEFVQICDNIYEQEFNQNKEVHVLPSVEYNYQPKLASNCELIEHLSDAGFTPLENAMIPEQSQVFIENSCTTVDNVSNIINDNTRNQQRILLESTMSPLLAAVNDITQREAQLQSCLKQSVRKGIIGSENFNNTQINEKLQVDNNVQINDTPYLHKICKKYFENFSEYDQDDEESLLVQDKPVEVRSKASLPTNYLYFKSIGDNPKELIICAKREIPARAKFGPFEGEIHNINSTLLEDLRNRSTLKYPILFIEKGNVLDTTNNNISNWMKFVRAAQNFSEQNLLLYEEGGKLYFKSCRTIAVKEELRVGYSKQYAALYGLKFLIPNEEECQKLFEKENPWPCFECDKRFATSGEMQRHLNTHEVNESNEIEEKRKIKNRKRMKRKKQKIDIRKNSSRCYYCHKVFITRVSLKKHIKLHINERQTSKNHIKYLNADIKCETQIKNVNSVKKSKNYRLNRDKDGVRYYECSKCGQNCLTPAAHFAHLKSNTIRYFSCVFCPEKFRRVVEFKNHIKIHSTNGIYTCNLCKKKYREYYLVRKHIRIFHSNIKFTCNECSRQFPNSNLLQRHRIIHCENREFLCSECGKQFKRKDKLREHVLRLHSEKWKSEKKVVKNSKVKNESHLNLISTKLKSKQTFEEQFSDYEQFMYKCRDCLLGFKRRGMLVNHIAKRHPEKSIDSIPELNLPILKPQSLFFCQYCIKVYKSNAKRKAHILKNHPGKELPPSVRNCSKSSEINIKMVGNSKAEPQCCQWCYKQYSSRNRLLLHYRKAHSDKEISHKNIEFTPEISSNIYRPPQSPENKLLKLSSAALELSSIEDRKFFDFLNERSQAASVSSENGNGFSKVDTNFKVVDSEFSESSSNVELNRLPQLFDESISCI